MSLNIWKTLKVDENNVIKEFWYKYGSLIKNCLFDWIYFTIICFLPVFANYFTKHINYLYISTVNATTIIAFSANVSTPIELNSSIIFTYVVIVLLSKRSNELFSLIFNILSLLLFENLGLKVFIMFWSLFYYLFVIFKIFIKMHQPAEIGNHLFVIFKSYYLYSKSIYKLFAKHIKEIHYKKL